VADLILYKYCELSPKLHWKVDVIAANLNGLPAFNILINEFDAS
jgi:hypothetical protein